MERVANWDNELSAYVEAQRALVKDGEQELCGLFAAGAVLAMTGEDVAAPWRGRYAEFAADPGAGMDEQFPERPLAFARRGDLALHDTGIGVVMGGFALFVGEDEHGQRDLVEVVRTEWVKAWAVGD